MTLPRPLRGWEEDLTSLQRPEVWAPMVQRLDPLVGAVPMGKRSEGSEPSGLGGLSRRGLPERLLHSTWALAEVAPDEFVRRAAQDELLYLRLDRVQPRAGRRAVVIFDTGPSQLGSARLAQLALWVVLNRRAKASGVELIPALLAEPERPLPMGLQESAVHAWLSARRLEEPTAADLRRILQRCGPLGPADVAWIVSPTLAASKMPQVRIVHRPEEPDVLEVRVGTSSTVSLPLPAPEVCARLLRQPFAVTAMPPKRVDTLPRRFLPAMVWSPGGHRLLVRTEGDRVAALSVPKDGRHGKRVPSWGHLPDGLELVAVGWAKQRVVTVGVSEGKWLWSNLEGGRQQQVMAACGPGAALGLVVPYTRAGGRRGAWVEVDGRLFDGLARGVPEARGPGSVWVADGAPVVAQVETLSSMPSLIVRRHDSAQVAPTEIARHAVDLDWMRGRPMPIVCAPAGQVVLVRRERVWWPGVGECAAPSGAEVLGTWMDVGGARQVWVVWLADGEVVQAPFERPGETSTVCTAVDVAAMSRRMPLIAWQRGKELGVFDLLRRSVRLALEAP